METAASLATAPLPDHPHGENSSSIRSEPLSFQVRSCCPTMPGSTFLLTSPRVLGACCEVTPKLPLLQAEQSPVSPASPDRARAAAPGQLEGLGPSAELVPDYQCLSCPKLDIEVCVWSMKQCGWFFFFPKTAFVCIPALFIMFVFKTYQKVS